LKRKKFISPVPPSLEVFGIVTPQKGYKLCFYLGKAFNCAFAHVDNYRLPYKEGEANFICYKSVEEDLETIYVIENECDGHLLSSKYKIADYFLIRMKDGSKNQVAHIADQVNKIGFVQTIFPIPLSQPAVVNLFVIEEIEKT